MKLWEKNDTTIDQMIESFTVGNDRELDLKLARFDVIGSKAHAEMLKSINILTDNELKDILKVLDKVLEDIENGAS